MKQVKDIYCDLGFWENLSKNLSACNIIATEAQALIDWYDLFGRSHIYFDCTPKVFDNKSENDPYLRTIWKKSTDGRCKLDFANVPIQNICDENSITEGNVYNSLFLSQKKLEELANSIGILNICSDDLYKHKEIFNDIGPSIRKEEECCWSQILNEAKHNCNSMVIVDNYIFQDKDVNLYKILDSLLPVKIDKIFYLSIFSTDTFGDPKEKKEEIEKKMCELRPNLKLGEKIIIEVFVCGKEDFHDRGLITNYMWIESGAGFNLMKKKGAFNKTESKKSTNIHITYPMIISEDRMKNSSTGYWNIIDDAKKCLKKRNEHSENRLLK
jgi:hypothetical protein